MLFLLFHLSVTKHSPRRGIEGTRWIGRGYTGTHTTHGEANAQINPETNKLTDLRRRDNHVRNIRRYPILPREHSPRLMEALVWLGPSTQAHPKSTPMCGAPQPPVSDWHCRERWHSGSCKGTAVIPSPGAMPGENADALAYSEFTALRQQTHKKISNLGPFSVTPTERTDLTAQLWSWGKSGASIFFVRLGEALQLLNLV